MSAKRQRSDVFNNLHRHKGSIDIGRAISNFYKLNKESITNIVLDNTLDCSIDFDKYIKGSYEFLGKDVRDFIFDEEVNSRIVAELLEYVLAIDLEAINFDCEDKDSSYEYINFINNFVDSLPTDTFEKVNAIIIDGYDVITLPIVVEVFDRYYDRFTTEFLEVIPQKDIFEYFTDNILQHTSGGISTCNYFKTFREQVLRYSFNLGRDGLKLIEEEALEAGKSVFTNIRLILLVVVTNLLVNRVSVENGLDFVQDEKSKLSSIAEVLKLFSTVNTEDGEVIDDSGKLEYISDWKQLSSLAKSNDFDLVRCKGDHGIFKNKYDKIVVIPQGRSVGKGLSLKIQKQILNG